MFVVYQWVPHEGKWGHLYFNKKENAEECALEWRKEHYGEYVKIEEIQTED